MDEERIYQACFEIAEDMVWEKDRITDAEIQERLTELTNIASQLYEVAKKNYYQLEGLESPNDVMVGAISFLKNQVIPPMRGNIDWFFYSLGMLLELCNPNCSAINKDLPFLLNLQSGICYLMKTAIFPKNENE